jgi:2-polyprenyl-6-methoxyphenol hydroxylase-like FAD-dependent oxidoreductase
VTRRGQHASAVAYGYWTGVDVDGYEWTFRPDACSGMIPTNDGQVCVFASASPARIGRGGVGAIEDVVQAGSPEMADRLRAARPPPGTRTWAGHPGFLRRPWGPGWALVGDAGYFKDPISSHGLTDSLRDAELLARAVVRWRQGDTGFDDALAEYEATRDRLSIPLFDVVDRIASQQWDATEISGLLRELSAATNDEVELLAGLSAPV